MLKRDDDFLPHPKEEKGGKFFKTFSFEFFNCLDFQTESFTFPLVHSYYLSTYMVVVR